MVAHSLLQKGQGMASLAPYAYEFLVSGEKEHAVAYVHFEDLPQTSQTKVLIEFLKRVSSVILHDSPWSLVPYDTNYYDYYTTAENNKNSEKHCSNSLSIHLDQMACP